ncbi:uroporphyrinogen decarboxylase family protein, partial [Candidatus Latescibacterota bacterium]
ICIFTHEVVMNSKERVKAVMNGAIPDKVPFGEFAIDFDTVGKVIGHDTYYRAKAKSQMAFWDGRRDEVVQSWKEDGIEFYRKMDCFDIINVSAMASGVAPPRGYECEKPSKIDSNTWEYLDGTVIKYSELTADMTTVFDPNAGKVHRTPADFEGEPDYVPEDESCFEVVDGLIDAFGGDRYVIGPCGHEVGIVLLDGDFGRGGGGFAQSLMAYYDNPETIRAAYRYEVALNNLKDTQYIRHGQDAAFFGHQDFASTQGPFISPDMFRDFALDGITERVRNVHDHYNIPVFKHACGNNKPLLDMFAKAGYDAYQAVQQTAGMDIMALKEEYGDSMVPWGGLNVETLVSGKPDDVRKGVTYAMDNYKSGGRYIFGSSHSIAVGTQYDNFMAMVDEFVKRRDY